MKIIYEDESIIVVDKPAGIATQSSKIGEKDLESELKKYRKTKGEKPEIYVIHRLDQPVSGLLVFAKDKEAAGVLSKDMAQESFSKVYEATVLKPVTSNTDKSEVPTDTDINAEMDYQSTGNSYISEGRLEDYLIKDNRTNSSRVAKSPKENGAKRAALSYKVLDQDEETARVLITLETGRHHQIRVQFSNAGMPLLGDLKYGSNKSIEISKARGNNSVALRAIRLCFKHPKTGKLMNFEA